MQNNLLIIFIKAIAMPVKGLAKGWFENCLVSV
jgi:hypothetical protein